MEAWGIQVRIWRCPRCGTLRIPTAGGNDLYVPSLVTRVQTALEAKEIEQNYAHTSGIEESVILPDNRKGFAG